MPYDSNQIITIYPGKSYFPCGVDISIVPSVSDSSPKAYIYPSIIKDRSLPVNLVVGINKAVNLSVDVYSILGELIQNLYIPDHSSGYATIPISVAELSTGNYFIRVIDDDGLQVLTFTIIQ